jgi:hypothetical protein
MAAIDENIHLDCVREPDILQKLLSSTAAAMNSNNNDENDNFSRPKN